MWYLNSSGDIKQLESVQCRAARWFCGSRWNPVNKKWSKSSNCCVNQLDRPLLHQRQTYFSICQVYNILHHLLAVSFTQYFSADNRHSNPSALDTSISTINPYRFSFFINSFGTTCLPIFYRSKTPNDTVLPSGTFSFNSVLLCIYLFLHYFIVFAFVCMLLHFLLVLLGSTFTWPSLLFKHCLLIIAIIIITLFPNYKRVCCWALLTSYVRHFVTEHQQQS